MELKEISVTYRKQVSDGNYGTEAAECTLSATVEPGTDAEESAGDLAALLFVDARSIVYKKLDESPSGNVRRALRAAVERIS